MIFKNYTFLYHRRITTEPVMPVEYYLCSGADPSLGDDRFNCPPPALFVVAVVLTYGTMVGLGIRVAWEKIKDQRSNQSVCQSSPLNVGCCTAAVSMAAAVVAIQQRRERLVTDIGLCLFKISYGIIVIASRQLYHRSDPVSLTVTPRFLIVLLNHFLEIFHKCRNRTKFLLKNFLPP